MTRVYSETTNIEILVVYIIRNPHLTIMRLVWMIETDNDMIIFSEALFDGFDKVSNIVSRVKNIHHIAFVDEYNCLFFRFIETDISDMILYELSGIFVVYLM